MPRKGSKRTPNLRSSIYYSESDGYWHGWVTMGTRPDGRPDRRHRKADNEDKVTAKVRELEKARDAGQRSKPDRRGQTVAAWLNTWLTDIAPRRVTQHTLDTTYVPKVRRMVDGIGAHRLRDLAPEHLDVFYTNLARQGLAPNTVLQVHRILSRALKVAEQRQLIHRSPAELIDPPKGEIIDIEPLNQQEAQRILRSCENRRNGVRWSVALSLGVRQGEALGLTWNRIRAVCGHCGYTAPMMTVDDESPCELCGKREWHHEAEVGWQIQQGRYRHGCNDIPHCTRYRHRRPCPKSCNGHHRETCTPGCTKKSHQCPEVKQPCPTDCHGHARECPQRVGGQYEFVRRKGAQPGRGTAHVTLALPPPLAEQLRAHHRAQSAERLRAGELWEDWDLVFARPDGRPIPSKCDYDDWNAILRTAGVRRARVHDARHTAATLLLTQGVDVRTVQQILGHSSVGQTQRYTHVTQQTTRDAASRMSKALWG
ncbi:tyrosine-type recombinase/integrase [Lipingzhangella sp. LS1_29]|uniref:Tyrosine-type recombinase/integrase n=1 Tax=Lipingzhangella rawalii TaxID=2055835 RepID=A0ABU2H8C3_9ACTN|nr:tyrosine-type recombinase/integrase [Lipingzhangella rawalii]MDS1271561.1 tyrosine-type recombinase/integrase [Lipingzhangella rawalii]